MFTPITETPSFSYINQEQVLSIASPTNIAADQLINIKRHLANLDSIKKIIINGAEVKKQEGYINDPSRYIKIVLWGLYADSLQEGQTCNFNKIRIRANYGQKYLNTPKKKDECTIERTEHFPDALVETENTSDIQEITAQVGGVKIISKYNTCISCGKKVTKKAKAASCTACKMTQNAKFCRLLIGFSNCLSSMLNNKISSLVLTSSSNQ